jgi:apolipoprotein N-acyltransferase
MDKKARFLTGGIALALFLICAWKMYQLYLLEQLWSYWTLGLLASGWLLWIMTALPIYIRGNNARWLMLSTLSGLLLVAGFPNSPTTFFMFIGFVPLLSLVEEITNSNESAKKRLLMRYSYNALVIWNIGTTWWVGNAGLIPGLIANFLNAFFMCLPILTYYIIRQKFTRIISYMSFISFWCCWEYLHLNWELSWPWLTMGNAFAQQPSWIQWYEYTGVFGGTLWILILNVLVHEFSKSHISAKRAIPIILSFAAPILLSHYIKGRTSSIQHSNTTINTVVIQPNFEPHYEKFKIPDEIQLKRFLNLSYSKLDSNTQYLLFPETSFGYFNVEQMQDYPVITQLQALADSFPKLHIVAGTDLFKLYAPSENLPKSVRKTKRGLMEIYNGAIQISADQQEIPIYKKGKMVPGAEIFPFRFLFGFLEPFFHKFNGTVEGLGTQPERSTFNNSTSQDISIAPLICYESIYGEYCTEYIKKGAKALFIMTNDGWWDDTPGYLQHLKFATLRAIELRRPIARSANTGASAFIDITGDIQQETLYDTEAAIYQSQYIYSIETYYSKYGDYIPKIAVIAVLLILIFFFYLKISKK